MKTCKFKKPILVPLTFVFAILLGTFAFSFYSSQQKEITSVVESKLASVEKLFFGSLESDAGMMGAALHMLLRDDPLKGAMMAKDRKAILDQTLPLFGHLRSVHGITHLYFSDADCINILRVHKPDKYGDKVDRFTTVRAGETQQLSWGIELGPLGTFTLRVVEPWYDTQQLVGFVELGREIEHITRRIHNILGAEIYVFIHKEFLDRESWESGMRMLGRDAEWDRFPSVVMIDQTQDVFPDSLVGSLPEAQHTARVTDVGVSFNDRHYRSRFIHLKDASGRPVGDMVVLTDVTDMIVDLRAAILAVSGICLTVGGVLFAFFYTVVGRAEKQVATATEELIRVTKAVESTSDAIIIGDSEGQGIYQNESSFKLFGYSREELKASGGPGRCFMLTQPSPSK